MFVVGASGATGKHLIQQLLNHNQYVKVLVRSGKNLPESWQNNAQLSIIEANISQIEVDEMAQHIHGSYAVACCLGHLINLRGIYGKPRRLVTDAVNLLSKAIIKNKGNEAVKLVLMNTSENSNRDLNEPISTGQKLILFLLRLLLPPHVDNEKAADYLRTKLGQNHRFIEWVAVRPDGLVNEETVSEYETYSSPIRSAIFNAGTVSRINVGNFMARLIIDTDVWNKWKGQMPVIYSKAISKK